jgi:hypothetical protein
MFEADTACKLLSNMAVLSDFWIDNIPNKMYQGVI